MSHECQSHASQTPMDAAYRKVLWICLLANALMFIIQTGVSYAAYSVSLLANSADFFSDAVNYGISLYVLNLSVRQKANASLFKGVSVGVIGLWVVAETVNHAFTPHLPEPFMMIACSVVALAVNIGCALLLYRYRSGDSNRESVWVCSRNDAIGNMIVMVAAGGVFASSTIWSDIIAAALLGWLALSGAIRIIRSALREHRQVVKHPS